MSSILKALKKLEEEKNRQQESPRGNISRDILREKSQNRKLLLWVSIAGIAALAVIATLSALLFTKTTPQEAITAIQPSRIPAKEGVVPPAATVAPPVSAPATTAVNGSKAVNTPVQSPTKEDTNRQQVRPALLPLPQPPVEKAVRTEMPDSHAAAFETPRPEPVRKPAQTSASEPAEAALTLSGIAWNKDSAERLAIINGQPAAIGTSVSGVVVEEIMPDRVKVNSSGRSIEIYLGKPAKSN